MRNYGWVGVVLAVSALLGMALGPRALAAQNMLAEEELGPGAALGLATGAEGQPGKRVYTCQDRETQPWPGGKMYVHRFGLLYVPDQVDEHTKGCLFFPGGGGEDCLNRWWISRYLDHFTPNAIMLFFYESGFDHKEELAHRGGQILRDTALELGIHLDEVVPVGSSNGVYAAMKAGPVLIEDFGFTVKRILSLDAGMNWEYPVSQLLSEEQLQTLRTAGTELYLFEQSRVGMDVPAIARMVEAGNNIFLVKCAHMGHEQISDYAFKLGVFSWAFEEVEDLESIEYVQWGSETVSQEYYVTRLEPVEEKERSNMGQ